MKFVLSRERMCGMRCDVVWCGLLVYDAVRYSMVWYVMVCDVVWYGVLWYAMVCYGMVLYVMLCYGMV